MRPLLAIIAGILILVPPIVGISSDEIDPDIVKRMQLEETSTPDPISMALSPSTVSVFEREQIESSGARFPTDVLRQSVALGLVRTRSTDTNVNVRGYSDISSSSQGIMFLIDGRQVYNSFYGNTLADVIALNFDMDTRIEMLIGPGGALYGPNAMHGVVNIITRSPLEYEDGFARLTTNAGSYNSFESSYTSVRKKGNTGLKTTLVFEDIGQFEDSGHAKDRQLAEFRLEHDTEEARIGVTGGLSQHQTDTLLPSISIAGIDSVPTANLETRIAESFLKANYSKEDLEMQATWTIFRADVVPDGVYTPFELDHEVVDAEIRSRIEVIGDHPTTVGAGARMMTFNTGDTDISAGRHTASLIWAYFHDELEIQKIRFTGGLRVDFHSTAGTILSPRVAAVYELDDDQSVRASFGMGSRAPSLRELWFDMPITLGSGAPSRIIGNRHLDPERITSFELSYFGKINEDTLVRFDSYYNFVDDLVLFQNVSGLSAFSFRNKQEEQVRGFETHVEHALADHVAVFASYAYAHRQTRHSPRDRINFGPQHRATAGVKIDSVSEVRRGISTMLWLDYGDETKWPGVVGVNQRTDSYIHVHAGVTCHFRVADHKASAFLRCWNLFNDTHREHPEGDRYGAILTAGFSVEW